MKLWHTRAANFSIIGRSFYLGVREIYKCFLFWEYLCDGLVYANSTCYNINICGPFFVLILSLNVFSLSFKEFFFVPVTFRMIDRHFLALMEEKCWSPTIEAELPLYVDDCFEICLLLGEPTTRKKLERTGEKTAWVIWLVIVI